jgi:hypothetical protein
MLAGREPGATGETIENEREYMKTETMTESVRAGERYESRVWLLPYTTQPAIMKVTRVTKHAIYYRVDYGKHDDGSEWLGSPAWFENTPEAKAKWLGERKATQ